MTAWATELEFAYDHGHLYVLDAARHWSEAEVGRASCRERVSTIV